MNYMRMMSTRKYMPEAIDVDELNFDALYEHIARSVRDTRKAVASIEVMTDQFDVYLNGRKIAVYMAGG